MTQVLESVRMGDGSEIARVITAELALDRIVAALSEPGCTVFHTGFATMNANTFGAMLVLAGGHCSRASYSYQGSLRDYRDEGVPAVRRQFQSQRTPLRSRGLITKMDALTEIIEVLTDSGAQAVVTQVVVEVDAKGTTRHTLRIEGVDGTYTYALAGLRKREPAPSSN